MGRVGALSAGVGSYNVVYGYTAFGTGWGDTVGAKSLFNLGDRDRMDNTVTYVTPKFGGLTAYAQYSFNANGAEDAQSSLNKRCDGLGLKYDLGAFSTGLVVDTVMNKGTDANSEDSLGVSWGASYDFGVAKVLGFAQVNYVDGESEGVINMTTQVRTAEFDRWGLAAAYEYPLSKRTKVYGFAGYNEGSIDSTGKNDHVTVMTKTKTAEGGFGLVHKF